MVISSYQINNVLRVYGDQLRHSRISARPKGTGVLTPDKINISPEGKRQAIIDRVASNIMDRITQFGPNDNIEREVFQKLENDYGKPLALDKKGSTDLIFKEIDEDGETINSLSVEDSQILSYKLMAITKETVNENMF